MSFSYFININNFFQYFYINNLLNNNNLLNKLKFKANSKIRLKILTVSKKNKIVQILNFKNFNRFLLISKKKLIDNFRFSSNFDKITYFFLSNFFFKAQEKKNNLFKKLQNDFFQISDNDFFSPALLRITRGYSKLENFEFFKFFKINLFNSFFNSFFIFSKNFYVVTESFFLINLVIIYLFIKKVRILLN